VSDPMYPGMSAPRSRPSVVTVSSYLLYLSAAASIVAAALSLTMVGTMKDVYTEMYEGTANSGLESVVVGFTVGAVVINVLFAAALAVLGLFDSRGRQGARITTWVVGGIFLCCNGFGLLGTALNGAGGFNTTSTSGPSAKEVEERISSELPNWFEPTSTLLTVVVVLSLLTAVILLALPAANEYFRKPAVGWDPLNQYSGYPAQQPPYPGQSPYPSYPGGTPAAPTSPPPDSAPPAAGGPGAAPTDPWSAPPTPPPGEDRPGRSPTDPA
jgi:hypothetical protein